MRSLLLAIAALLLPGAALAQSGPNWKTGYVPSAAEWQAEWTSKADKANGALTNPTVIGGTVSAANATANSQTNTLATWMGYLSGTSNPNPMAWGSGATSTLSITPFAVGTFPANGAQMLATLTTTASGGTAGQVSNLARNVLTITGAPNQYWWAGLDILKYQGSGGTGQHVARYAQALRYNYAAGGASNNPQIWALVGESDDFTGQKTSLTNAQLAGELDLTGHNVDDANQRQLLVSVIEPASDGTIYYEAGVGHNMVVVAGAYAKRMNAWYGNATTAALDLRYVVGYWAGAAGLTATTFPTVTSTVTSGTSIPVSNVMPFTSDYLGRDINHTPSTSTITFSDGQTATVTAYSITGTGPTPAGTLTVSAPISEASGNTITTASDGLWLATGMPIALDNTGATSISSNASTITMKSSAVVLKGSLSIGGAFNLPYTTVSSSSQSCTPASIAVGSDQSYIYVCTAANVWKRAALNTF